MVDVDDRLQQAHRRARYTTGIMWHAGMFLIINGFFLAIDLLTGAEGVQWAHWIALVWSFGLASHVLAFLIDGRQTEARLTRRYAREE